MYNIIYNITLNFIYNIINDINIINDKYFNFINKFNIKLIFT